MYSQRQQPFSQPLIKDQRERIIYLDDLEASNRNIRLARHNLDSGDTRLSLLWMTGLVGCLKTCTRAITLMPYTKEWIATC